MLKHQEIERNLITKYRKDIWRKFSKAVKEYELVEEDDKIAVCISGGKDSFILAKLMEELQKHGDKKFELVYLVMNPGYTKEVVKLIKKNAKLLNLDIHLFDSDIFKVTEKVSKEAPCYLCARMRRGVLYKKAQELGCNKIALGHHFDDVIETVLMSILYGGEFKSMPPKLRSTNFKGMELIRPLYLVRERDIIKFCTSNDLEFINCACTVTSKSTLKDSKRLEIKKLIAKMEKDNPLIPSNIFASTINTNIDTLLGYKTNGKEVNFKEKYQDNE
ncbi:MAG: tRNA 2-thiocytidine biosynthesis protein TtcA [Bacilli bacterium]|nr:tRNA 2-thiocytidine biosynthesis protein TtcA [Bacilli bacterium]